MANEKTPVVWDDDTKKHRPLGTGEKMGGLSASSIISSDSGNLIGTGSDGLAYVSGSGIADPAADNLIESTAQGKLKVDADRIAEWLDGHPDDAAAIADAINAVSGDPGNVIVQGTDKGALLTKEQIAAALAGLTDAQKQALAQALAGQLASQLADGHTIVASGGKLKSDPTNATAAEKAAINDALADSESGLVVDPETGKLTVDFSQMPTDRFEDLLKGLRMKVPLTANKSLYVSVNDSRALEPTIIHHDDAPDETVYPDGIGQQDSPFKKLQDCVNYATQYYAVGKYHISIRVVAGTYNENITLPDFDRGTGYIEIVPDSGARDVTVVSQLNAKGTAGWCFNCSGGYWILRYLTAQRTENPTTEKSAAVGCYQSTSTGLLDLYGCAAVQQMPASPSPLGGETYAVRVLSADSEGRLRLRHSIIAGTISTEKSSVPTTPSVVVFNVARGGSLWLTRSYDANYDPVTTGEIACSGSCNKFLDMWQSGAVNTFGSGTLTSFTGTVEGKRYELTGGSHVSGTGGSATFFPGDEPGTLDDGTDGRPQTYCWYA